MSICIGSVASRLMPPTPRPTAIRLLDLYQLESLDFSLLHDAAPARGFPELVCIIHSLAAATVAYLRVIYWTRCFTRLLRSARSIERYARTNTSRENDDPLLRYAFRALNWENEKKFTRQIPHCEYSLGSIGEQFGQCIVPHSLCNIIYIWLIVRNYNESNTPWLCEYSNYTLLELYLFSGRIFLVKLTTLIV